MWSNKMTINKSLILEVSHDSGFERYHIRYVKKDSKPDWPNYRKLEVKGVGDEPILISTKVGDIYDNLSKNNLIKPDMDIYYCKAPAVYESRSDKVKIDINDTQQNLFNIPINLLLAAATTRYSNMTYYSTGFAIARLIRHHAGIEIIDDDRRIGYQYLFVGSMLTFNELSPRSIQHEHLARLLRCPDFVKQINNGNLVLAYADIVYGNLDDDVINGNVFTRLSENDLYYDQFTGTVKGNMIEVTSDNSGLYRGSYDATELDAGIIELLHESMKYMATLPQE